MVLCAVAGMMMVTAVAVSRTRRNSSPVYRHDSRELFHSSFSNSTKFLQAPPFHSSGDAVTREPYNHNSFESNSSSFNSSEWMLPQKVIDDVKAFVFFVGYPRSGNSITGSMLDAHPHIVVSHELHFFRNWKSIFAREAHLNKQTQLYNEIYANSVKVAMPGRARQHKSKGYSLRVPNSWQGKFDSRIEVIGDKGAGAVSHEYLRNATEFIAHLQELKDMVSVPVKVIHVVRNPYDMITTGTLYEMGKLVSEVPADFVLKVKETYSAGAGLKVRDQFLLKKEIMDYFDMMKAVVNITRLVGRHNVLEVHLKNLVHHPRETILSITNFFGVAADEKFLKACSDKIFSQLSHTRNLLQWPHELVQSVQRRINDYKCLRIYNFTSD